MKNLRGFTIVELVITILIGGILLTMAVPSFRTIIQNNRITTQANQFLGALSIARSEATRLGIPMSLCSSTDMATCSASPNWENGWIIFTDGSGALRALDGADTVFKVNQGFEGGGALVEDLVGGTTVFSFDPSGRAFVALRFQLSIPDCKDNQARTINISVTGRAAVTKVACP